MSRMKQLATDLAEYHDEIEEVVAKMKKDTPHVLSLIMNRGVTSAAKRTCIRNFTDNEKLVELILFKNNT